MEEKKQVQFENVATVEGEVLECSIEEKEFKDEKGTYKALAGEIVLKTDENETHKARYFVKELTSKGEPNKIFTNVKTALENLVTLQDIATHPKEFEGATPTRLRVRGELSLNEFYDDNDKLHSNLIVRGVFLNRVKEEHTYTPKAEFDVEGIVIKTVPEIDREGEETGRVKVTLLIPTYNSALPIEFISRAEDGEYIQDNFESGITVNIYGKIVNYSKKIEVKKEAGFGESKSETKYENVRELQIVGGNVYDEENSKSLSPEEIKELSTKRNVYLAQLKEKQQQRQQDNQKQKPVGFGGVSQSKSNTSSNKPKVDVSNLF